MWWVLSAGSSGDAGSLSSGAWGAFPLRGHESGAAAEARATVPGPSAGGRAGWGLGAGSGTGRRGGAERCGGDELQPGRRSWLATECFSYDSYLAEFT